MSALIYLVLASAIAPDRVVVFPDRAQVTRAAPVSCGARVPITFEGIPPVAAQDSFRARVEGGSVDGLRSELVTREKEFSPKAEAIAKQLEALDLELAAAADQLARAQAQTQVSRSYLDLAAQLVSRELAAEKPDVKAWQTAFDVSLSAGVNAARAVADANARLRELRLKQAELRQRESELRLAAAKQSWVVEVLTSCPAGRTAEATLTYVVGGASWTPAYEARADEPGKAVELSTWATVTQATGEDWSQVELTLSTAVPSSNATPPELKTLLVRATERPDERKVLVRRDEFVERAKVSSGGEVASAEGQARARSQGLSVQLAVPERAKVPGDGAPVRLFVGRTRLAATFEVRTVPRAVPLAFRVAELSNQAPWPLLPGRLDAFRSTGLVGRYALEHVPQGGAFTLSFGVEDTVRVKRSTLEELKRDTGVFKDKRRFTYAYRFELANYGRAATEVALAEQVPVSELSDISVSLGEKTTPGYQLDPKDGIARWTVSLKPGEKKTLELAFRVDVPTTYELGGL